MPTRQQAAREFVKTWSSDKKGREDADRQTFWNDLLQRVYGNDKVDEFAITMFIRGKKMLDAFRSTEKYALYDVKTQPEIVLKKGESI